METKGAVAGLLLVLLTQGTAHAERETLYVAGDSIAAGVGTDDPLRERYAARLRGNGMRVRVVAYGGRCLTFSPCTHRKPLVQKFEEQVLGATPRPDRVIVAIGVNDLAHVTDARMRRAYRTLRRQGKAKGVAVHIATIAPTAPTMAIFPREWIEPQRLRMNRWIRQAWPKSHIDFAKALEGPDHSMLPKYDGGDGLHPNALGARAIADAIKAKLLYRHP